MCGVAEGSGGICETPEKPYVFEDLSSWEGEVVPLENNGSQWSERIESNLTGGPQSKDMEDTSEY